MTNFSRKIMRTLISFALWGIMTPMWAFVWYEYYSDIIQLPFYRRGNWVVIAIYAVLMYIITQFYGGYRIGFYRRGDIIFSCLISMIVVNMITYFQTSLISRDFVKVMPFVVMSIADIAVIWIWATFADKLYRKLNPPHRMLCIYGGDCLARSMIVKMAMRDDKYIIQEAVNIDEGLMSTLEKLENYKAVLICDVRSSHRNRIIKYCFENGIRAYMMPKISDIILRGSAEIHLFDSPLLLSRNDTISVESSILKRAFDIIVCAVAAVIFLPIMLIIAAAIKIQDGGPVLFKQERLTINGRLFILYKFRSMIVNAEEQNGVQLATENDARITSVGRFIRKIRFDEIPQIFNILKGDMSIVGPRPERPEIVDEYRKVMPEFDFRLKVKAGLTGYAQVLGKYNTSLYDKLKLDLMYIMQYSFQLDIKLILMTIKILFMKQSTEGIADSKTTAVEKD